MPHPPPSARLRPLQVSRLAPVLRAAGGGGFPAKLAESGHSGAGPQGHSLVPIEGRHARPCHRLGSPTQVWSRRATWHLCPRGRVGAAGGGAGPCRRCWGGWCYVPTSVGRAKAWLEQRGGRGRAQAGVGWLAEWSGVTARGAGTLYSGKLGEADSGALRLRRLYNGQLRSAPWWPPPELQEEHAQGSGKGWGT